MSAASPTEGRNPIVPVHTLYPMMACCCAMSSMYCTYPACLGFYSQQVCGCLHAEQVLCKPSDEKAFCWTNTKLECMCRKMFTCSRLICQGCCLDVRYGIPSSPQHPYLCTFCFLTCWFKGSMACHCCQSIETMQAPAGSELGRPLRAHEHDQLPSAPAILSNPVAASEDLPLAMVVVSEHLQPMGGTGTGGSTVTSARNSMNYGANLSYRSMGSHGSNPSLSSPI